MSRRSAGPAGSHPLGMAGSHPAGPAGTGPPGTRPGDYLPATDDPDPGDTDDQ